MPRTTRRKMYTDGPQMLLQAMVPVALAEKVKRAANLLMMSQAAYLRRVLLASHKMIDRDSRAVKP